MSQKGLCSRREADEWIQKGWVFVNNERITTLGFKIDPEAHIEISKEAQKESEEKITIIYNKPLGIVSGTPEKNYKSALEMISEKNRDRSFGGKPFQSSHLRGMAPAGRLDIDSTGLLLLTQDGRIAKKIISENSSVQKEYLVRVSGALTKEKIGLLQYGLSLDGKKLKKAQVELLNNDFFKILLTEGKKRQVRRMCELLDLKVEKLKRTRIGFISLGGLKQGFWRYLDVKETLLFSKDNLK